MRRTASLQASEHIKLPRISHTPSVPSQFSAGNTGLTHLSVKQDKYFVSPKLQRIMYSPIAHSSGDKENANSLMLQSCLMNKNYEDVADQAKEGVIKGRLGPKNNANPLIKSEVKNRSLVGKDAALRYYNEYKKLDKIIQKKKFLQQPESDYPCISILEQTENLSVLPCCLGLIKTRGQSTVLNLNAYNLGDKYICAMSAGLKEAKLIEKIGLSRNRITDNGVKELMDCVSAEITCIDLSYNKICNPGDKLLAMIQSQQNRLQHLNLESNLLKDHSAKLIFHSVILSRHLKYLNLRKNGLTVEIVDILCQMLEKSQTLEELYIGSNFIGAKAGEKIFVTLANNKLLKVLDYSLNMLGEEDGSTNCAKAIASCFSRNKTLQHIDLSSNNFNFESSRIIAEGLQTNKTIYGVHFRNNYGYVDSRGFLILQEKQITSLHSFTLSDIEGFEVVSRRQHTSFESCQFRNVCWICQGWLEQQFKFTVPPEFQGEKKLVYLHFDFEKYRPRLININEKNVKYTTMVPPRKYRYFFTFDSKSYYDSASPIMPVPIPEVHTYEMDHSSVTFKVEQSNVRSGKSRKLVNEWNELLVKTLPRVTGLVSKKEKEPWMYSKSAWAKQWKLQDEELLKKCFQRDWKCSKIGNLVKNQADQDKVKEKLWQYYSVIKNVYRNFAAWSPFGDIWAVSSNPFTEFCQQAKIISKDTPLKIIDLTFITTNSMSGGDWKGNSLVPERGLVRFQFMEALVRLAQQKFKKMGVVDNFADSVNLMMKDHIEPLRNSFNSQKWRLEQYFIEENDVLIKKYRPIFTSIYKKNSKLKLKPGEKPFMCLTQFKSVFQRCSLTNYLIERDIFISFSLSMMTQVDQLQNQRFMKMSEIEFIEGCARCSALLPSTCVIGELSQAGPTQWRKFEWMIQQMKNGLCGQQIKSMFSDMEGKSIFVEDQDD